MEKLTVMEVYNWTLNEADHYKSLEETYRKGGLEVASAEASVLAQKFLQVAAKLELTEEVKA